MQHFRVSSVAVKILPDSVRVCEDLLWVSLCSFGNSSLLENLGARARAGVIFPPLLTRP